MASAIIIYNRDKNKMEDKWQVDPLVSFNERFESYEGTIKGAQVKSLISTVKAVNMSNVIDRGVTFNGISNEEELANIRTTIKSSYTYNISFEYDEKGLIKNIICEEVK